MLIIVYVLPVIMMHIHVKIIGTKSGIVALNIKKERKKLNFNLVLCAYCTVDEHKVPDKRIFFYFVDHAFWKSTVSSPSSNLCS